MSSRKILALGAVLALQVAVAHAQGTDEGYAVATPVPAEAAAPSPEAASAHPDAQAPAPMAEATPVPGPTEPATVAETKSPLGDAMAQDTSPALGTPPPQMPSAVPPSQPPVTLPPPVQAAAPAPAVAAVPAAPRPNGPVPVVKDAPSADLVELSTKDYRKRLAPCIDTGHGCDKRGLTTADRDYLRYDRGEARLSRDDLDEVAEARMMQFDGTATVLVKKIEPPAPAPMRVTSIVNRGRSVASAARTRVFGPRLEAKAVPLPPVRPEAHAEAKP